jgi:hypothetical protein
MLEMVSSSGVGFGLVIVTVLVALVLPTIVLANVTLTDWLINPATPVPLSVTTFGLVGELEGIVSAPEYVPTADAVKLILTVQLSPGIPFGVSVTPEQPSAAIPNCDGLIETVPIVTGTAEVFNAVSIRAGLVVVPKPGLLTVDAVKATLNGVTYSGCAVAVAVGVAVAVAVAVLVAVAVSVAVAVAVSVAVAVLVAVAVAVSVAVAVAVAVAVGVAVAVSVAVAVAV